MIAHFVDCPDNFGDVLYPVILEKVMRDMGVMDDIQRYSFLEGDAPLEAGYPVRSIQDLMSGTNTVHPRALFIGGGELLRASQNKERGYLNLFLERGLPLPSFFWKKQYLYRRLLRRSYFNQLFTKRYMNYPSVGPYIINAKEIYEKLPIAFCSCGGPNRYPQEVGPKVRDAMEQSSFIYLRDEITRERLVECGVQKRMHVAPDLICLLSDYFSLDEMSVSGNDILKRYGLNPKKKTIVFQSFPLDEQPTKEVLEQLSSCADRCNAEICLLPMGYCHNDHKYLETLSAISGGAFKYLPAKSIFDIISVVAASDCFIGTSMHGSITAFSYGKPFLIAPTRRQKQQGFLKAAGLYPWFELECWSQIQERLAEVLMLEPEYSKWCLRGAKDQARETARKMLIATQTIQL